jgi:hypothetical protein
MTGSTSSLPLAFGLDSLVLDRSVDRPFEGLVLGFVGEDLPEGWLWCDGEGGTPDLRGRYILLEAPLGPTGQADHTHQAPHMHSWATAPNIDQPGYFGDPSTQPGPTLAAAPRTHRHSPAGEITSDGSTTSAPNAPPAVGLRFIIAGPGARRLPDGVVVAYTGRSAPFGWRPLESTLSSEILGRLLKSDDPGEQQFRLSGEAAHDHILRSRHLFILQPTEGSAGTDRLGPGPPVPVAGHRHRVLIEADTPVALTDAWPPYVSLLLIVKD